MLQAVNNLLKILLIFKLAKDTLHNKYIIILKKRVLLKGYLAVGGADGKTNVGGKQDCQRGAYFYAETTGMGVEDNIKN